MRINQAVQVQELLVRGSSSIDKNDALKAVDELTELVRTTNDATVRKQGVDALRTLAVAHHVDRFIDVSMRAADYLVQSMHTDMDKAVADFLRSSPTLNNTHWQMMNRLAGRADRDAVGMLESTARMHPYVSLRQFAVERLAESEAGDPAHEVVRDIAKRDFNDEVRMTALAAAKENKFTGLPPLFDYVARNDHLADVQEYAVNLLFDLACGQAKPFLARERLRKLAEESPDLLPIANYAKEKLAALPPLKAPS